MKSKDWTQDKVFQEARSLLKQPFTAQRSAVAITGAGISKASGLATFRGEGGHWRGQDPQQVASKEAWQRDPRLVWDFYSERRVAAVAARPNAAHVALADWAKPRPDVRTFTQNVDGLHELAGHRADRFWRLHGTLWANRCTQCDNERSDRSTHELELPHCPVCEGLERPAIVMFQDRLPPDEYTKYCGFAMTASLVLVIGTSGLDHIVSPIASAAMQDAPIIMVDPNPWSSLVTHPIAGPAEQILPQLLAE